MYKYKKPRKSTMLMASNHQSNINNDSDEQATDSGSIFCRGMIITVIAASLLAGGAFPAMVYLTSWSTSTIVATGLSATVGTVATGAGLSLWSAGACKPDSIRSSSSADLEDPSNSGETQPLMFKQ